MDGKFLVGDVQFLEDVLNRLPPDRVGLLQFVIDIPGRHLDFRAVISIGNFSDNGVLDRDGNRRFAIDHSVFAKQDDLAVGHGRR